MDIIVKNKFGHANNEASMRQCIHFSRFFNLQFLSFYHDLLRVGSREFWTDQQTERLTQQVLLLRD